MSTLEAISLIIVFVGFIMLLIQAFKVNLLWGFGCLLLGPVSILFIIMHWDVSKKAFIIQLAGLGMMFAVT